LAGKWGVVDVDDCVAAAQSLSKTHIHPQRLFIRGGSAGGYTTLQAICNYPDVFAGATSLYGISDLFKLTEDTHKFESKYMDKLLGGTVEEIPDVYRARSPVYHAEKIKTPLLVSSSIISGLAPFKLGFISDLARFG
jgi:dipeptidyl aminopeptidase/acylaminoacyl peptidase